MRTGLVAAALLASSLAAPARAASLVSPAPSPPPAGAEAAADALVEQAAGAYDHNRLDEALGLLARAYELSARPSILYNQAQVLRAKDDCAGALDAYSRFVDATTPDDPNRDRASRRRDEMQTCVDRRKADRATAAPPPVPVPPPAPPPTVADRTPALDPPVVTVASPSPDPREDDRRRSRRLMRVGGWALVGAGVVAAGVAAALAWQAHDDQNQLNQAITLQTPWQRSVADQGQRDATWARWLGAAAAVAGGGGVALLIVSRPPPPAGGLAGAPPSRGTAALVGWSGTF
ncbi:MAG: hypothetical protein ABUS79_13455 [Pseudomonadota bacterium]